jgi:hypothetical protein
VVEDLLQWRALWDSVIADRQPSPRLEPTTDGQYNVYPPLSLLRTTRYDDWPADTLYIWTDQDGCHACRPHAPVLCAAPGKIPWT